MYVTLRFAFSTTKLLEKINEEHYGIAVANDRTGGAFANVSKQLIRMDDGTNLNQTNSKVWVSKSIEKAEAASPTLKSIEKILTGFIKEVLEWRRRYRWRYHLWALRDAADQAGYYKDGKKQNDFGKKLTQN